MNEPYRYLGGEFIGPWTEDEAAEFIQLVEKKREEERAKKEASDEPK